MSTPKERGKKYTSTLRSHESMMLLYITGWAFQKARSVRVIFHNLSKPERYELPSPCSIHCLWHKVILGHKVTRKAVAISKSKQSCSKA